MKHFLLIAALMLTLWPSAARASSWFYDYHGTVGEGEAQKVIGLTLTKDDTGVGEGCVFKEIKAAALYYKDDLADIPFTVSERDGRNLVLTPQDETQDGAGILTLTFMEEDPQHHYRTNDPLCEEVLTGTWASIDGTETAPVYLNMSHAVAARDDGGRCYLPPEDYAATEQRIQTFYHAFVAGDAQTLKDEFGYSKELSATHKQLIMDDIPHNLFCKEDGIMLGSGVVWFDAFGNVINP